ncbi:hypothetical protein IU443_21325 [Nocardia farcinica]|uniref:Large secreted protein n=1 Tax=Nocardia farcinica TaxID=37329 RepID=A0A0H5P3B2_NOCFR|nr:hypothetical protein [Nocardia farcinica]AXK87727.1 hypothetical protein DXT66_20735 [Nocardia farcinica]MBF6264816.1 hypothetical protein [Nocardia farcinica]MBF6283602.1 hypothetical protein [Nocardia farcinica]MBF6307445.1 hypothetical protein [Nocardia farcinica]MBF6392487.1 hypothetical protein [Nocardia farcinica]
MYRRSSRRLAVVVAVALIGPLAASCGEENDTAPQNTATSAVTSTAQTPTEAPDAPPGTTFTPDPTIVDAHPIPFTSWTRLAPDRLAVHFQTGTPECYGIDVTTTETDSAVTIELRSGRLAEAADRMCVMIAVFGTVEVQLDAPLGARQVLSAV